MTKRPLKDAEVVQVKSNNDYTPHVRVAKLEMQFMTPRLSPHYAALIISCTGLHMEFGFNKCELREFIQRASETLEKLED